MVCVHSERSKLAEPHIHLLQVFGYGMTEERKFDRNAYNV